ncbi:MAG: nucleotidyltransferase family protein [Thermodesulfobacteriota bacterium]
MGTVDKFIRYDAVLVAGEGEDSHSVLRQHKAFLKIKDKFVIQYVIETLQQVPAIGDIYVAGPVAKLKSAFEEAGLDLSTPKKIHLVQQKSNLFENAWHAFLSSLPGYDEVPVPDLFEHREKAVLVVACDAPLITPREVIHFIDHCDLEQYDFLVGLTPEERMTHFYPKNGQPGMKMAYLHMKEKNFRINNLQMVRPMKVIQRRNINTLYAFRYQKNIINAILLGIYLMGKEQPKSIQFFSGLQFAMISNRLGFPKLTRLFSSWTPKKELEKAISGLMNTRFAGLEVPFPGAALDIDNDTDFRTMGIMFDQWRDYLAKLTP